VSFSRAYFFFHTFVLRLLPNIKMGEREKHGGEYPLPK